MRINEFFPQIIELLTSIKQNTDRIPDLMGGGKNPEEKREDAKQALVPVVLKSTPSTLPTFQSSFSRFTGQTYHSQIKQDEKEYAAGTRDVSLYLWGIPPKDADDAYHFKFINHNHPEKYSMTKYASRLIAAYNGELMPPQEFINYMNLLEKAIKSGLRTGFYDHNPDAKFYDGDRTFANKLPDIYLKHLQSINNQDYYKEALALIKTWKEEHA